MWGDELFCNRPTYTQIFTAGKRQSQKLSASYLTEFSTSQRMFKNKCLHYLKTNAYIKVKKKLFNHYWWPYFIERMTNALFLYYANKKAPMELDFKNEVLLSAQQVLLTDLLVFASED